MFVPSCVKSVRVSVDLSRGRMETCASELCRIFARNKKHYPNETSDLIPI